MSQNKIEQWIEALPKYEKSVRTFVPVNQKGKLKKINCACALGVYLIEVLKQDPQEIASSIMTDTEHTYWKMLYDEFAISFVNDIWEINDNVSPDYEPDDTFNTVIKMLKEHV